MTFRSRKVGILLMVSVQFLTFTTFPTPSRASTLSGEVATFEDCQLNEEVSCIESISITTSEGQEIQGVLRPEAMQVDYQAGAFWHARGKVPVYEFPGSKFAYGTNTVFIRTFYWPNESEYCAYGTCTKHNETIISYVNPYAPGVENPQFNTDSIFHMVLRAPIGFKSITANGRARNVRIVDLGTFTTPKNEKMTRISASFTPIHLEQADFGSSDPTAANQAIAFEDSPALWLYGRENDATTKMGPCAQIGGLDVFSNAVSMDMPRWNAETQSIDIWTKSPHLTTNGEVNIGYIEARIPISMALCLWGVSLNGKIEGKIAITYDDGSPSNVVTMTGSRSFDDYLLVISGFHFSAPTFHVVLNETMSEKQTVPAPLIMQPKSLTSPTKVLKTIMCKRGKVIKRIRGISPKCPKGYSKA